MKAMILAAGYGKRMHPMTLNRPKPLVEAAGKPLVVYQLERLAAAGFTDIVINHGWLGEQIEEALGDGSQWRVNIRYSSEEEPLETGGGIFKALPLLTDKGEDSFLVVNADIYTDIDYSTLELPEGKLAHLVMVDTPSFKSKGDFNLADDGTITETPPQLTFSGVSVLSAKLFGSCQPGAFKLPPILIENIRQAKVSGHHHQGYWMDVGTLERLKTLEQYLGSKYS